MPDTHLLVSEPTRQAIAAELEAICRQAGRRAQLHTPESLAAGGDAALAQVGMAFLSPDVLGDSSKTQLTSEMAAFCGLLDRAPALAWVQLPSSGWDRPQFLGWQQRGVTLCNAKGVAAVSVAQSALGGMLALARRMPVWMEAQRRAAWEPLRGEREPEVLEGKTVVVVGLGAIGQEMARLCQALRMRVIGVSESGIDRAGVCHEVQPQTALDTVLPRADWVVLCCPLTPQTKGLFNGARLAAMKRGAQLVDVSRGGVLLEASLLAALDGGQLRAAYLDVFESEPLLPGSRLWTHPAVLVSPHSAGDYQGRQHRLGELFCQNLQRSLRGEPLLNVVAA